MLRQVIEVPRTQNICDNVVNIFPSFFLFAKIGYEFANSKTVAQTVRRLPGKKGFECSSPSSVTFTTTLLIDQRSSGVG